MLLADDWLDNPQFFDPKRNYFSIICRSMNNHIECQIVSGPHCGLQFMLPLEFDNNGVFEQICSRVKDGLPASGESAAPPLE